MAAAAESLIARHGDLVLTLPGNQKGIGKMIQSPSSADLIDGVQSRLDGTPVEGATPVLEQSAQLVGCRAKRPVLDHRRGPARGVHSATQFFELGLGNVDPERDDSHQAAASSESASRIV